MQSTSFKLASAIGASLLLVACGGGGGNEETWSSRSAPGWTGGGQANGGGGSTNEKSNTAQGFWNGPVSSGFNLNLAVLENGEAWGIYVSGGLIQGAVQGSFAGEGTALTGKATDYNFSSQSANQFTVEGTINQKSSIEATLSGGATMSLVYSAAYDQPASLEVLAGNYTISGRTFGGAFTSDRLTISPSGAFVLEDEGCTATGSLAPRSGGKNVFSLNVSFAGEDCLISGSVAGVGYLEGASFVALALNAGKSDGMFAIGSKL